MFLLAGVVGACGSDTRGRFTWNVPGDGGPGGNGQADFGMDPPMWDEDGGVSCPPGTHAAGGLCLTNEITCGPEFPCPMDQECAGGRCVSRPGQCTSNDQCPVGFQCINGTCQPVCPSSPQCQRDADCPANNFCIACTCVDSQQCATPTADISGNPFTVQQVLRLNEALSSFQSGFIGIMKKLRDGIAGCPGGSGSDCWIYQLISLGMPQWAKNLVTAIGNFGDVIDGEFKIQSQMTFKKNGKPSGYDGIDHWLLVSFEYQNKLYQQKPENVPQIGKPVLVPFTASGVCGVLYVDKHKVEGVLSGLLRWLLDTVIQVATCANNGPCYKTLGDAVDAAINCNQFQQFSLEWITCNGFKNGLKQKLNDLVDSWLLDYALLTLQGTATVNPNGRALDNGKWDGTLGNGGNLFNNFSGTWFGKR